MNRVLKIALNRIAWFIAIVTVFTLIGYSFSEATTVRATIGFVMLLVSSVAVILLTGKNFFFARQKEIGMGFLSLGVVAGFSLLLI